MSDKGFSAIDGVEQPTTLTAPISISDPGDRRLELYRALTDAALRRRIEAEHGVFVVEGARSLRTLLASPYPLLSMLLRPERLAGLADVVAAAHSRQAPVYVAGRQVFDGIAGFPVHRGVLALAGRLPPPDPFALVAQITAAVVVEGVNDHENLGAIFRNAAALGAGAVLLDPSCCDPLYRRSVRVSMAQVLRLPFSRLAPWPGALTDLRTAGFTVVALDPGASESIDSMATGPERPGRPAQPPEGNRRTGLDLPADPPAVTESTGRGPPTRLALLIGAEGTGLTEGARRAASHRVRIPMTPGVDSLNVATALAIALHRLIQPA
jgi:tRNA G18 (ribose-2'-O)-methylase SpoU